MKTLLVPDMHCLRCVARIETALKEATIPCQVNLDTKTVAVPEDRLALAIEELDDLGFDAQPNERVSPQKNP